MQEAATGRARLTEVTKYSYGLQWEGARHVVDQQRCHTQV